jgi:DNA-binding XRE family transcriptional regulator
MDAKKKARLTNAGWRVGDASEFLGLTNEEIQLVEMKLALSRTLREVRSQKALSQVQLAHRLGSSQSRVAKMEAGDPSVSVDLLMRALLAAGASKDEIASAIVLKRQKRSGRIR